MSSHLLSARLHTHYYWGGGGGRAQRASQCPFFPGPFPPPFLLGPAFRGPRVGVASKAAEERTQGSLFQPRRQRAPLSTPGPSPRWVSVCEGVEPVQGGPWGKDNRRQVSPHSSRSRICSLVCLPRSRSQADSEYPAPSALLPALASLGKGALQQGSRRPRRMALQCPRGLRGVWDLGETLLGRCWRGGKRRSERNLGARGMRKPVRIPATELPGDPVLLPEPSRAPTKLPPSPRCWGGGVETQLLPCFQWHKNKKADGAAPSAHPPTGSLGLSAPPPSLAQVPSQSMDHVIPRRGGTRELYPLPPSFQMTSLSLPPLSHSSAPLSSHSFPLFSCLPPPSQGPFRMAPPHNSRLLEVSRQPLGALPGWGW